MAPDRPLRDWATWAVRGALLAGIAYGTWKLQTIETNVSMLQQDVAYIMGKLGGGRTDR